MKLAIIIPALNESELLGKTIAAIPAAIPGIDQIETTVIDDGSTDRTADIARAAGAAVIPLGRRMGLGVAFRAGIKHALAAGADIIVNMDADGQFDPADIPALIAPVLGGEADFATCTRFARRDLIPQMPWAKRMGNRAICGIVNFITHQKFTDVSCGFRAYSRDTALRLNLFGDFTYTQESFIDLVGKRIRITEVPLRVRGVRESGESRIASNLPMYALRTSSILLRAARDLKPMKFFGSIGLAVFSVGVLLGGFVLVHWLMTGKTTPYSRFLTGSSVGLILGFLLLVLALIADMLGRQRRISEEVLYLHRKEAAERARRDVLSPGRISK